MKGRQLTFAREYRGMTQKELASAVSGLSQSNLSKYEHGLDTLSDDVVSRIMRTLGFPVSFLSLDIRNEVENKHYRKRAINVGDKKKIDREISIIAYVIDSLYEFVEYPDYTFGEFDLEDGISPEDVARQIRRQFRLGEAPIMDICSLLESNGVIVYYWNCPYDEFDGVSLITDKGNHVAVVNRNKSNDRIRFTLAHELGHILMHECLSVFINENRDKEQEANAFASEFLMPEAAIKNSLLHLKMSLLPSLKSYWLTSMASIVQRAKSINRITDSRYIQFRAEFSRNRWNKKEPTSVGIDAPSVIDQALDIITHDLSYTPKQLAEIMYLPEDVYTNLFGKSKILNLKQLLKN